MNQPSTSAAMVAAALEMPPELVPLAAQLLVDFEALGSDPDAIASTLANHGIGPHSRVVDLGSGKGAAAFAIAERCRCEVVGLDLHQAFVDASRQRAAELGLAARCRFAQHDVAQPISAFGRFDAAVFAALGTVLGSFDETIAHVRDWVRPGGLLLISDVFLRDAAAPRFPGFEAYHDLEETRRRLTAAGDVLVAELLAPEDDEDDDDDEESAAAPEDALPARVAMLSASHPELAGQLRAFLDGQVAQTAYADEWLSDAIWVLRLRDHP